MSTNKTFRFSRLGVAALAVLFTVSSQGQLPNTRYQVTILGPGNANVLPSMGIDPLGRVAGFCNYVEKTGVETKAWTFDPNGGYALSTAEDSNINGVSPNGLLVGSVHGTPSVFDWLGNPKTVLPTTSGCFMAANRLNQIVGYVNDPKNGLLETAVLYNQFGALVRIGATDGTPSGAYAINDAGIVVGYASYKLEKSRAYYWNGNMVYLPKSIGITDVATGINNRFQIIGYTITAKNRMVPVRWVVGPGVVNQLAIKLPLGFMNGEAQAINDSGQTVGTMWDDSGEFSHAFVTLTDGTVVDMNDYKTASGRAINLISANAINANGMIAGLATLRIHAGTTVQTVAYVAKPVTPAGSNPRPN